MSDFISHVKLENFEILRLIGSGGAGSVYLAKQCNLERLVAIKTIRRSCDVTDDLIDDTPYFHIYQVFWSIPF